MRSSSVAICSTVRDCEIVLRRNIPIITKLREQFRESFIVVVENDSKDMTKDVLSQWAQNTDRIYILSKDLGIQTIPECTGTVKPWFSAHRISLMAKYRNEYLDFIESNSWQLDYIIIVDLDVSYISIDGIANSFGQNIEWDAIASNGKDITMRGYCYYDTYAFRETTDNSLQTEESIFTYQNLLKGLTVGMPMFRVASAFGGLSIYKADAIKQLRYRCEDNKDPCVGAFCEHVTFHHDMAHRGYDKIFINPSQEIIYETFLGVLKSTYRRIISKLIRLNSIIWWTLALSLLTTSCQSN
jgi:hypothetical protein